MLFSFNPPPPLVYHLKLENHLTARPNAPPPIMPPSCVIIVQAVYGGVWGGGGVLLQV